MSHGVTMRQKELYNPWNLKVFHGSSLIMLAKCKNSMNCAVDNTTTTTTTTRTSTTLKKIRLHVS